jgi:hypothetical protein
MSSVNPTCVLLFSLAENARNTLPHWYNDVYSQARNLCAPHEPTGALTLVATDYRHHMECIPRAYHQHSWCPGQWRSAPIFGPPNLGSPCATRRKHDSGSGLLVAATSGMAQA